MIKNSLILFLTALSLSFSQTLVDGVAAIVGDKAILLSEVNQVAQLYAQQMGQGQEVLNNPQIMMSLQAKSLQELINQEVMIEYARQETLEVEEKAVRLELENTLNNLKAQYGSLDNAAELFGVHKNKLRSYYEDQIMNNKIIELVQMELFSNIKVSRREVEHFYETFKDSFPVQNPKVDISILSLSINAGEASKEKEKVRMLEWKRAIEAGELKFEDLAREYSADPGSAQNGGNLGFVGKGIFVKPFEEAAYALEPGELSDIVETMFGLHLLRLEDKKDGKVNVSHILIPLTPNENDKKLTAQKINTIYQDINDGNISFAEAVERYSQDEEMKLKKGHLGLIDVTLLPPELQEALEGLKVHSISSPVFSSDQFHIIQLNGRKPGGKMNLNDHWFDLEMMATSKKKQEKFERWIQNQRDRMFIQIKV
jgi:peptidyl-prolyl cis-trans isomerase SurA